MNITSTPYLVSFAGNPMRYLLTSDPGSGTGGIKSVIRIRFASTDTNEDHAITVEQNGAERVFTLKASPTTKDHLPVAESGYSAADWASACYYYLINDSNYLDYYEIELVGNDIVLTAITASPDYDITQVSNTITGVTIFTDVSGAAPSIGDVEGVMMKVYKNGTTLLGEEYKPVDASGNVRFEVSEYIYANLLMSPPPRFNNSLAGNYWVYHDYICKYRVVFTDRVNGVFLDRTYGDSFRYAIPGGLNRDDLVYNNLSNIDFFSLTTTQEMFMSWASTSRITDIISKESLFYMFQDPTSSYTKATLKMTVWDSNGANETTVAVTDEITITPWTVVEFTVGYAELGLQSLLSGDVATWKVFLENENDDVISDEVTFTLDQKYHEHTRYFRFRNSWGVYDSMLCTGKFEMILQHDREKVSFISEDTESVYNSPDKIIFAKELQQFKANSGFISSDQRQYLRDMERSFDIYEYADDRLMPVNLTAKKSNLAKDDETYYYLAFEYERAYQDFFFSRMRRAIVNRKNYSAEYSAYYS